MKSLVARPDAADWPRLAEFADELYSRNRSEASTSFRVSGGFVLSIAIAYFFNFSHNIVDFTIPLVGAVAAFILGGRYNQKAIEHAIEAELLRQLVIEGVTNVNRDKIKSLVAFRMDLHPDIIEEDVWHVLAERSQAWRLNLLQPMTSSLTNMALRFLKFMWRRLVWKRGTSQAWR